MGKARESRPRFQALRFSGRPRALQAAQPYGVRRGKGLGVLSLELQDIAEPKADEPGPGCFESRGKVTGSCVAQSRRTALPTLGEILIGEQSVVRHR